MPPPNGTIRRLCSDASIRSRKADIIVATMLFMEEHAQAVLSAIQSAARQLRRGARLHVGARTSSSSPASAGSTWTAPNGARSTFSSGCAAAASRPTPAARGRLAMLRRIPRILRFIPGPAQDVRAYFLTLQYWLAGSDENIANLVRFLLNRYAGGAQRRTCAAS